MTVRNLPWGKLALLACAALLMTADAKFPDQWALARQLHPQAQKRFLDLLNAIVAKGYRVVLTSAYRAGGNDYHGFGLALDLNLVHVATGRWYRSTDDKATWESTGVPTLIRKLGFRWGGDFVTPWVYQGKVHAAYDPVHVDLGAVYDMTKLRARALQLAGSPAALVNYDRRQVALA